MSVKNRSVYRAVQALKVIITQILFLMYAGLTPTFLSEPSNISRYPQQRFLKYIVLFWWQSDPAIIMHFLVKKHHIATWAKKYSTFYMIIIISGQWKWIHLVTILSSMLKRFHHLWTYTGSDSARLFAFCLAIWSHVFVVWAGHRKGSPPASYQTELLPCDFLVSLPEKPTTADSTDINSANCNI